MVSAGTVFIYCDQIGVHLESFAVMLAKSATKDVSLSNCCDNIYVNEQVCSSSKVRPGANFIKL